MSPLMKWLGFFATLVTVGIIPYYALTEPELKEEAVIRFRTESVLTATDLYAENCAVCHGASGEGIATNPALDLDAIREMSTTDLSRVIARGRDNTQMAAWAMDEGGIFTNPQVEDIVTMLQYGNWDYVRQRVAELGLMPPEVIVMQISEEMIANLNNIPNGESLAQGLTIYAESCSACHGGNAAGTVIAPALNTDELRAMPPTEMAEIINEGVPGTLMASWAGMLTPEEVSAVMELLYRWPDLMEAGVEMETAAQPDHFSITPEMIATGDQLYDIACTACHGLDAYGSPMAPALNNQIFLSQTPDAAIYQIIAGGVSGTLMPAWGNRLNDDEIRSIVAYLRSLEPAASPILPPIEP